MGLWIVYKLTLLRMYASPFQVTVLRLIDCIHSLVDLDLRIFMTVQVQCSVCEHMTYCNEISQRSVHIKDVLEVVVVYMYP